MLDLSRKHDRATELRAIADGRLLLNVRNGVTVSRSMLAKIADEFEAMSTALTAKDAELAEVRQQYVDANEARIDAEAQLAERGKPFIAAAEEAYWLLAWTWQSHLTGPGKPFDMSIFAPEARNMMTKAEQDLFDALSEIEP